MASKLLFGWPRAEARSLAQVAAISLVDGVQRQVLDCVNELTVGGRWVVYVFHCETGAFSVDMGARGVRGDD
jgi:hypothetical protein